MKRREFIFTSVGYLGLFPSLCRGDEKIRFVVMADPQFGLGPPVEQSIKIIQTALSKINMMEPEPLFLVVLGDLTHVPEDSTNIDKYISTMNYLKSTISLYNIPGNHDLKDRADFDYSINIYNSIYGPDRYDIIKNEWNFVFLNSSLMRKNILSENYHYLWVEQRLSAANNIDFRGSIIFLHHPFYLDNINEDDTDLNIPKYFRYKYLDLFAKNNVKAIFNGHLHKDVSEKEYNGIKLINTDSICVSANPGLRIVEISNSTITHSYYKYNALPSDNVNVNSNIISEYILTQSYPNPFNNITTITYSLAFTSYISITIYNNLGVKIACLKEGVSPAGMHSVNWEPVGLSSGVYFYSIKADRMEKIGRMMYVK